MDKKCHCKTYRLAIILIALLSLISIFCTIKITTYIVERDYVNISFRGKVIENIGYEITVEGLPTNEDYFRGIYQVSNPGQVIIVDENFKEIDYIYNIISINQSNTKDNLHD